MFKKIVLGVHLWQEATSGGSILELLNKLMSSHRQPGEGNESESINYNCTYNLTPDLSPFAAAVFY